MPVTVYRSTDTSAPTLSGTAGDLVNVLDKCLVTGYGSKAAAGWTKPYTGTSAAVFRMGGGNQFYLDVNDNAPGAATAQEARLRGYETMTAVATGTGLFPTVAQSTPGIVVRKSAAASGTSRAWALIGDDRTFYLLIQSGDTAGWWYCFTFGDFYSYLAGTDAYRTVILGRTAENLATAVTEYDQHTNLGNTQTGAFGYAARAYTGLGGSTQHYRIGDIGKSTSGGTFLIGVLPNPNPVDGRIWVSPTYLGVTSASIRGEFRGLMHYLHTLASVADQDTVSGVGPYAGRTFQFWKQTPGGGVWCFDVTGPWNTN